jgi:hypothetical protein
MLKTMPDLEVYKAMQYIGKISNLSIRGDILPARLPMGSLIISMVLVSTVLISPALAAPAVAQPAQGHDKHAAIQLPATTRTPKVSPYHVVSVQSRTREYFQSAWGVNNLQVHMTASGNLIRFSYGVTDPVRAMGLGDIHATPFMYGQRSHALLRIPVMEKVGQLRQSGVPVAGKEYWMVFSNKGSLVKPGDRVNVVIGSFHADGLLVE